MADFGCERIRQFDFATKAVTTLAGQSSRGYKDATGTNAQFAGPSDIAITPTGKYALVGRVERSEPSDRAPDGVAFVSRGFFAMVADVFKAAVGGQSDPLPPTCS